VANDRISTYKSIDTLETSLHRLVDRLPGDNTGSLKLNSLTFGGIDGTLSINRVTEGIDDSSEKGFTDWDIDNSSSSLDDITFLNFSIKGVS
jgi:hypothetical protein